MKNAVAVIGGLVMSVVVASLVGFLTIQIAGLQGGAVFGLDNQLAGVTEPNPGYLQVVTIAVLGGVSLLVLANGGALGSRLARLSINGGFLAGGLGCVVAGFLIASQQRAAGDLNVPRPEWLEGWIGAGGTSPVILILVLVAAYQLVTGVRQRRALAARTEAEGSTQEDAETRV